MAKIARIDPHSYTRACAKRQVRALGWFLYYTGACGLYLDYQVWKTHFRWWHPFTWFVLVIVLFAVGFANIKEVKSEMFVTEKYRHYPYRNIPHEEPIQA